MIIIEKIKSFIAATKAFFSRILNLEERARLKAEVLAAEEKQHIKSFRDKTNNVVVDIKTAVEKIEEDVQAK